MLYFYHYLFLLLGFILWYFSKNSLILRQKCSITYTHFVDREALDSHSPPHQPAELTLPLIAVGPRRAAAPRLAKVKVFMFKRFWLARN
jgi:hypothetical protein